MSNHHVLPVSVYIKTYLALLVLMILTVGVAVIPSPVWKEMSFVNNLIAMAIASAKAIIVLLFFMNVKFSTKLTQVFVVAGFATFALMFLAFIDYGSRKYEESFGWEEIPATAFPRSHRPGS